jgi:energy-coupling factor transporter ATP-binding protein EcfA2
MKLSKLNLINFKFHHNLEINFNEKSTLIYGENGVGKSSIYEALRVNLHPLSISRGTDINEYYKHRDYSENMQVDVLFDKSSSLKVIRKQNNLTDNLSYYSVFANEKKFHQLLEKDFYLYLEDVLKLDFPYLAPLVDIYRALEIDISRNMTDSNKSNYIDKRINADNDFIAQFQEKIDEDEINDIIQNHFKEDFKIKFNFKSSLIIDLRLKYPAVSISIAGVDDRGNFQEHFNEAKQKLISIAIYFSLAKKQENYLDEIKNETKILILDDFLTSLDMSNRKLIVQYILTIFNDYQIIILTHNIQFNNLILNLLKSREEDSNWLFKNLFSRIINNQNNSIIYDRGTSYLETAENYLNDNHLQECGNFLRKEFERIIEELRHIHEIGSKEKLHHIIDGLLKRNIDNTYRYSKTIKENINNMKEILQKTKFYQDTILHSASHDDISNEIYEKDCKGAIETLTLLNKYIKNIKGN